MAHVGKNGRRFPIVGKTKQSSVLEGFFARRSKTYFERNFLKPDLSFLLAVVFVFQKISFVELWTFFVKDGLGRIPLLLDPRHPGPPNVRIGVKEPPNMSFGF